MDCKINLTQKNPQENAGLLSKLLLWHCFHLFHKGKKYGLNVEDLWRTRKCDMSGDLGTRLEEAWFKELQKAKRSDSKPSLARAIVRCFWLEYMILGIVLGILFILIWPIIPYSLALFINYFTNERSSESYKYAHIYNMILNLCIISTPFLVNLTEFGLSIVGMKVRIACCSLMYRKMMRLSRSGLSKTETGQVINLMSNDVGRFDVACLYLHYIWVMPVVIIFVSYLVWQRIAWAALAGLGVIILQTLLVQTYLSSWLAKLRGKIAKRTDERVKVMSELVNGVQVIKMYAWEKPFEKLVENLRKLEVKFITHTMMIKGFSTSIIVFTERLVLYAALVTFIAIGGEINSEITFSLAQYYNLLQIACNIYFPWALAFLGESKISVQRLEEFLLLNEVEPVGYKVNNIESFSNIKLKDDHIKKSLKLELSNVTASWQINPIVQTLRSITLEVNPGEFVGIVGSVGSGKSSLLQLILGELQPNSGRISLGGATVSYASQDPWLFVATVRQNILFGLPYDKARYNKVVEACALLRDFEQLPGGDGTMVGERGASLSGGQRARVGLARACYRQADIYLLDDPLSAVDTHVGKHLVSECINGLLRHSTRVLVTHQLHHLKTADKVVILRNGEIEAQGTFEEVSRSPHFDQLHKFEEHEKEELTGDSLETVQDKTNPIAEDADDDEDDSQETDELLRKDSVSGSVYLKYFRAGGSWMLLIFTILSILIAQVVTSAGDLWLSHWMNNVETNLQEMNSSKLEDLDTLLLSSATNSSTDSDNNSIANLTVIGTIVKTAITLEDISNVNKFDHFYYIYIWSAALLGCIILTSERSLIFMWVCMRSSIKLHNEMFSNILTATMRFFNTNPSGRILNRFSKDMGAVDEMLPKMYIESIQVTMVMFGIIAMVAIVNPYMLLTTLICGAIMYLWSSVYLSTAQIIRRLEGITRSPVFSHVSASMSGLATVRACQAQTMLCQQFDAKQDVHTAAWYLSLITNASFSIWLSVVAALYVLVVTYSLLLLDKGDTKSGDVGLAVSQAIVLVNMLQYGIKQVTQVVSQMTSVERILEYTNLPQEISPNTSPPKNWPQQARIVFKDLYLRYEKDSEPVLKNLNIVIDSCWKVGVVGRTGAGKSSLISALFRLAPIDGHVYIDDIDTGEITLKDLRSKISIIPQEPVLFSASLRYNLDPFDKYSDADIWKALEQVKLKDSVTSLSSAVESGGSNFSAGERQLLCLARAALASNRLLILDEATANVDPNTDALIQKSIREHFADCTVVTVAHRLHTVADSDRIIVMEAGQIVEFGDPHKLLQKEDGHFIRMVNELGSASEQSLRELAKAAFLERNKDKSN
ncbi:ATP-binding cassette subfamily C member 4-like isoform X1 [Aricia agestis]|uniref:ATP-binding cassette subfamily C member 4-like isoform X1 n=1 Tax=Aricia agestis TaxID=91739 RepID=UPI001C20BBF2|nr:ATP-binding cassette subfamily C member 4-like isoform X1 [Aricia agestis]